MLESSVPLLPSLATDVDENRSSPEICDTKRIVEKRMCKIDRVTTQELLLRLDAGEAEEPKDSKGGRRKLVLEGSTRNSVRRC